MSKSVAHDPLQSVKSPEHAFVHGEDRSQPPIHRPGQEAVARTASQVAARSSSCQLHGRGRGKLKVE